MQDTELPEKIEPTSLNFQTELASQLAELVPEAMSDGKLDVTKLREMVNGDAENSPEKFGLFWPGKRAAQALAQIPTTATLIPAPEESEDWDSTKNIFIEGDNLEVLKALQNSYRRKVKMIYIDPPYNTGKEFIYPDKFSEGLQGYLEYTGQKNEAGENVESKPETGGRRHSNWLSMMYPRLQLAKSLLADDGVIFISIDDNEQSNLKKICDEVFGEDNFLGSFIWKKKGTSTNVAGAQLSSLTEYILCFARNSSSHPLNSRVVSSSERSYPFEDSEGKYRTAGLEKKSTGDYNRESMKFEIIGHIPRPGKRWQIGIEKARELESRNRFIFDNGIVKLKIYDFEDTDSFSANPNLLLEVGSTQSGQAELDSLMENTLFDTPKPVSLLEHLLKIGTKEDSLIVDFFSGSGTTAHAVMRQNAQDGGMRRHVQVQLPEITAVKSEAYKAGYKTIADISKERIRRAGKKIREEYTDKITNRSTPLDAGFRVYKLASSSFVQWDENKAKDDIQQSVLDFAANKKPDAAPEALLTEIMLQARMPLSANIEKRDLQSGGWVYVVDGGNLIAYVANEQITEAQANEIADLAPAKLIVLDSAFNGNNALKINVANICKEKFIKEFKTI